MTAYNVVRFKVKPDQETAFVEAIRREMQGGHSGLLSAALIKTGERSYCEIGEWDRFESLVKARPAMLGSLDSVRDMLEDMGAGLGVTDAVSGEAVAEFRSGWGADAQEIHGEVLSDNTTMLAMCRGLGFAETRDSEDRGVVRVSLRLDA